MAHWGPPFQSGVFRVYTSNFDVKAHYQTRVFYFPEAQPEFWIVGQDGILRPIGNRPCSRRNFVPPETFPPGTACRSSGAVLPDGTLEWNTDATLVPVCLSHAARLILVMFDVKMHAAACCM